MPARKVTPLILGALASSALLLPSPAFAAGMSADDSNTEESLSTTITAPLDNTIKLNNCSAALVRFPSSKGSDKGMMLTNGHCLESGMPKAGQVITNQSSSRSGELLDGNGKTKGNVQADMIIYASMTDTDVSLYRLTQTFDDIAKKSKGKALVISEKRPENKAKIHIASGYWKKDYVCSINGFVRNLHEDQWKWHDSIRYNFPGCKTIHGTSGSPVIDDKSGQVVGVNNTGNDDGKQCTMNNPCEEDDKGKVISYKKGQSYGQQTYWIVTCQGNGSAIDLKKKGCKLHGGTAGPMP